MGPRDHPRPLPDGARCTACGAPVPSGRIRILARRDDLAFVELDCIACGSAALGLLIESATPGGEPILDVAGDPAAGRWSPWRDGPGDLGGRVEAIRDDLAAWDGDLVGWLEHARGQRRPGSVVDR